MVNGFKGGDWNELTETMNVRQKHAHSWVEAYVGVEPDRKRPDLDHPRPDARRSERQESIAQVGGIAGNFRPLTDLDPPHLGLLHRRLRRRPPESPALRADAQMIAHGSGISISSWDSGSGSGSPGCFISEDISAFISIRGFIVSFVWS